MKRNYLFYFIIAATLFVFLFSCPNSVDDSISDKKSDGIITVNLSGGAAANGHEFSCYAYNHGDNQSTATPLATGSAIITGGTAIFVMKTLGTAINHTFTGGKIYDIHSHVSIIYGSSYYDIKLDYTRTINGNLTLDMDLGTNFELKACSALFTDDFNRPAIGSNWIGVNQMGINSSGTHLEGWGTGNPGPSAVYNLTDLSAISQLRLEYTIRFNDANSSNIIAFVNNDVVGRGYLLFFQYNAGAPYLTIYNWDGSLTSNPSSITPANAVTPFNLMTDYIVRMEFVKSTNTFTFCFLDATSKNLLAGSTIGTATDTTYTGMNKISICNGNSSTSASGDVKNPIIDDIGIYSKE